MQKVVGLDLGTYSIKVVEIINNFKSYEIKNFHEKIIPDIKELPRESLIQHCLEETFAENEIVADRIVTALPGQYISSRIMTFNFSDPRKIAAAVRSELEELVPFDLDDMIVDQQILGMSNGKTNVLVVMTQKKYLANFLDNLKRINIDPKLVDIDSLAFYNFSAAMNIKTTKCVGLVDIGHEKTSICFVENGILRMFRSFNLGGKFITEFLARDLQVSFYEAQRIKHQVGKIYIDGQTSKEMSQTDLKISRDIAIATNSIVKELGRTLYSFKTYEKLPIETLYLSGGSANLVGIDKFLAEQLATEVVLNELSSSALSLSENLGKDTLHMPQAIAIGLRAISAVKRVSSINLRKGEFAYVQDYEKILNYGFKLAQVAVAIVCLLTLSYFIHYFVYQSQINKTQDLYRKEAIKIFPELGNRMRGNLTIAKSRDIVEKRFDESIREMQNSYFDFLNSNKGSAALVALAQISEAISKDISLETTLYQFTINKNQEGKLVFKAEVKDYATGTDVLEAMKKVAILKNVIERSSGTKPGTNLIDYTIHADLNNTYDLKSYL